MNSSQETISPIGGGSPDANAIDQDIRGLKQLLKVPVKERDNDWEQSVDSHVGRLSVDYLRQSDGALSLREFGVVQLAASAGVRSAKNRSLRPKWSSEAPPSVLDTLEDKKEIGLVIKALSKSMQRWAPKYAAQEAAHPKAKPYLGDLSRWLVAASPSWEEALSSFRGVIEAPGFLNAFLATTSLICAGKGSAIPLGSQFVDSAGAFADDLARGQSGEKNRRLLTKARTALCSFIMEALAVDPALATKPGIGALLGAIDRLGQGDKSAAGMTRMASERAAAILSVLYEKAGDEEAKALAYIARSESEESSPLRKALEAQIGIRPSTAGLIRDAAGSKNASTSPVEAVLSALLPEIEELQHAMPDDQLVSKVKLRVDALVNALNMKRIGEEGNTTTFDPFMHVATTTPPPSSHVRVVRPGLAMVRPDGSHRVILKAVVEAISN